MFRAHVLIVRRPKLYYTVSGIITPIGGRSVHRLVLTFTVADPDSSSDLLKKKEQMKVIFCIETLPLTTHKCTYDFRRVRKIAKGEYELRQACPAVCPHETTRLPLDGD